MAKVKITTSLKEQIFKIFKKNSVRIFKHLMTLENNPQKGKALSQVSGIVVKELKYEAHRFYFITDGHILKFGTEEELAALIIKFVKMSDKKDQQKAINQIKKTLEALGFDLRSDN